MDGLIAYALAKKYTDEHGGGSGSEGIKYYSGSGAPTSAIVAKAGDIYRDTTNNKIYQCTQYVTTTDLTNMICVFNNALDFNYAPQTDTAYNINFTDANGDTYKKYRIVSPNELIYVKNNSGSTLVDVYFHSWQGDRYKTVTFTGGDDVTNADLLTWVINNAVIQNAGSAWVELVAKDTRVPDVTSADEGKVLQVNSSGNWSTSNAFEEEVMTFTLTDNTTVTKTFLVKVVNS